MTKTELIAAAAEKAGLSKKDTSNAIDATFAVISESLAKGEKCTLVGFGTFEVRDRAAREGRNPQDPKKVIKIPATKVAAFKPGKELKEKVAHK